MCVPNLLQILLIGPLPAIANFTGGIPAEIGRATRGDRVELEVQAAGAANARG